MIRILVEQSRPGGPAFDGRLQDWLVNPAHIVAVRFAPDGSAHVYLASNESVEADGVVIGGLRLTVTDPPSIDRLADLEK